MIVDSMTPEKLHADLTALLVKLTPSLPEPLRPQGLYLWVLIGNAGVVVAIGLFGGISTLI